jgi:hypothetical protein
MSQYTQYPFYTAYTHLHDIFGVDMAEDMFETSAFVAWRNIGNKITELINKIISTK